MIYYRIKKTCTSKKVGSREDYQVHDKFSETFSDMESVKESLKSTYGKCKRVPTFIDKTDGTPEESGKIYCYREGAYFYQDWVEVLRVSEESVPLW